ncbi:hypothetical protein [Acinetobacter baumannii]|nr:hypothetical protein [Acinetobacter baumannii]
MELFGYLVLSGLQQGGNYINDAKTYADQQDLVIDANAKRHVQNT